MSVEEVLRMTMDSGRALVEAGLWRARLDDLMARQPARHEDVAFVIDETLSYLRG